MIKVVYFATFFYTKNSSNPLIYKGLKLLHSCQKYLTGNSLCIVIRNYRVSALKIKISALNKLTQKGEFTLTKKAVTTRSGELLIGEILTKENSQVQKMLNNPIFANTVTNETTFLKRDKHLTFLAKEEIESIRDAHPWEKESEA